MTQPGGWLGSGPCECVRRAGAASLAQSLLQLPRARGFPCALEGGFMVDGARQDDNTARRVQAVVADRLGVEPSTLVPQVSLRDELAVDSLDLLDVMVALEDELGVVLPERMLDEIRTIADLVSATVAATRARRQTMRAARGGRLYARLVVPRGQHPTVHERVEALTPYAIQTLVETTRAAGAGSRLEVMIDPAAPPEVVEGLKASLERLAAGGVAVQLVDGS